MIRKQLFSLLLLSFSTWELCNAQIPYSDSLNVPNDTAILIEFTASWCAPCKQMEATTLKDSTVLNYIDSNYFWIVVDVDQPAGKEFAAKFHVNQYPTFIAWDKANNEVLLRIIGYQPTSIFRGNLEFALDYTRFEKK